MQKFVDRAGRIWIVDIDNTTLRRVKTLTGVHLLEAIDGDLIENEHAKLKNGVLKVGKRRFLRLM